MSISDNLSKNKALLGFLPPLPRREGARGRAKDHRKQVSCIRSNTPSKFSKTSLFQNRSTLNPASVRSLSLSRSFCLSSACCPPSTSLKRGGRNGGEQADSLPFAFSRFNKSPVQSLPFQHIQYSNTRGHKRYGNNQNRGHPVIQWSLSAHRKPGSR